MTTYASTILADSPQAYYRLDEASGLVAHDMTSHGYDGTLSHVSGYSQAGAISTESDTSMLFGTADTLSLPYTLNLSTWTALSVETWIQLTQGWQHVVATADSNGGSLYLNGVPYTSGSGDEIDIDQGLASLGSLTVSGNLDEVAIYNYQLSALQVLSHYSYLVSQGVSQKQVYFFQQPGCIPGIPGTFSGNQEVIVDPDMEKVLEVILGTNIAGPYSPPPDGKGDWHHGSS